MPDVGIVMPVYKQVPSYLRRAIRSIRRQSYKSFGLVIVIDGMTSSVVKTIRKEIGKDRRIKVIAKRNNQGVAAALNIGFEPLLRRNDIKYLTWVSSDNIYRRNFIRSLRENLMHAPQNVGLTYSCFYHINHKEKSIYDPQYMDQFCQWQNQPKENLLETCFVGTSFMYKKEYALMAGGYDLEPVEDYDYWLKLTDHCDIQYISNRLMGYRVNTPYSVSAQLNNNIGKHRQWRYSFMMAKHQARVRRGIPFETTIVYPIHDASETTMTRYEALLEQTYSNYKVIVIDLSPGSEASNGIRDISDPRVHILAMPSADRREAIKAVTQDANTPFTMIYDEADFSSLIHLQQIIDQIRNQPDDVYSVYSQPDGSTGSRNEHVSGDPINFDLYKTHKLLEVLNQSPVF